MTEDVAKLTREGERIEDLLHGRLKILQKEKGYRFSVDPLLLTDFVQVGATEKVIDLGTGSGVIPLILADRTKAVKITGIEIQPELVDMAKRSIKLNGLQDRIRIKKCDVNDVPEAFKTESFEIVISNPPYYPVKSGKLNPQKGKAIARHELLVKMEDVVRVAHYLLKPKGHAYLIYPATRTIDLLVALRKVGLEPKEIKFVHSNENSAAKLTLVKAVKGANPEATIHKPLYIYNLEGDYTDEAVGILENGKESL